MTNRYSYIQYNIKNDQQIHTLACTGTVQYIRVGKCATFIIPSGVDGYNIYGDMDSQVKWLAKYIF